MVWLVWNACDSVAKKGCVKRACGIADRDREMRASVKALRGEYWETVSNSKVGVGRKWERTFRVGRGGIWILLQEQWEGNGCFKLGAVTWAENWGLQRDMCEDGKSWSRGCEEWTPAVLGLSSSVKCEQISAHEKTIFVLPQNFS